jgi:hypothetical protein
MEIYALIRGADRMTNSIYLYFFPAGDNKDSEVFTIKGQRKEKMISI